jgi:PPOX class probable F420-dependent enzyme
VDKARVARLGTVDAECKPHLIPVVFVFDNNCYFIPIDEKHKRSTSEKLRRTKNIRQNSNVVLLIDEYNEDWTKLYFIMIQGNASIIGGKKLEQNEMVLLEKAHQLLYEKYLQYQKIGVGGYVIIIDPKKVSTWMTL